MTALLPPPLALLVNGGMLALGAALAAVPIVIHLLNRRRVQRVPWAAMQWLLAAMRRHQRRLRLENWLILALRVAAVLLLGLALARPVLTDPGLAGLVASKQSVYLVIDTSYSMGARIDARTISDLAKAEADAVLSSVGSEDTIAVIATNDPRSEQSDGRAPFVLLPRGVGNEAVVRAKELVAGLFTRHAPAPWAEALERLEEQMAPEDVNRRVVLITDFQARDWNAQATEGRDAVSDHLTSLLRAGAAVRIVDVGGQERRNLTVAQVLSPTRREAFANRPLRLAVTVENQGPRDVDAARLDVFLDDQETPVARRTLPLLRGVDPGTGEPGSETVTLDVPPTALEAAGSHVIRAEVTPPPEDAAADALGLDSRRWFALRVRERIRVVSWTRSSQGASLGAETYLRGVYERYEYDPESGERIERNPLYDLKTVETETALADLLRGPEGDAVDLVVLANVEPRGPAVVPLADFVRGGGALLAFVGDRVSSPDVWNEAFHDDASRRLMPFALDAAEVKNPRDPGAGPFEIDLENDTGHPLAEPFTGEDASTWIGLVRPQIWGRMAFREPQTTPDAADGGGPTATPADDAGRVVLRYTDGRAAVVEGGLGTGRTLWVSTSVDQGWFERALPFFLPVFLDESAVYLTRPDDARRNLEVGRRILVTWLPRGVRNERFVVPGGLEVTPTRYEGLGEMDRPMLIQDRVGTAGDWKLRYERETATSTAARTEEHFAVNPDPAEGALARARDEVVLGRVPPESDLRILTSFGESAESATQAREGEISTHLLWLALGLLLLESALAWLFGRRSVAAAPAPGAAPGA
jgi:hypothetical protein